MSELEMQERSRVRNKGIIQYASDQINSPNLGNKDTMAGIKTIAAVDTKTKKAILLHEAEKDKIINTHSGKNPTVTGPEIEEEVNKGLYREGLEH